MQLERVRSIAVIPALDTVAYASGDRVGTVMDFAGLSDTPGDAVAIIALRIVDLAVQKAALNLWLFRVSPTIASADNAALDITDANLTAVVPVGFISIAATDYVDTASNAVGLKMLPQPGLVAHTGATAGAVGATGHLYGLLESAGTPTYAAGSLTVTL